MGAVSLPQLPSCGRYLLEALCALDHQARGRWEISRKRFLSLHFLEENLRSKVLCKNIPVPSELDQFLIMIMIFAGPWLSWRTNCISRPKCGPEKLLKSGFEFSGQLALGGRVAAWQPFDLCFVNCFVGTWSWLWGRSWSLPAFVPVSTRGVYCSDMRLQVFCLAWGCLALVAKTGRDCNVNLLRIPGRRDRSPASRDQVGEEPPRCRCPCQHLPQRRQQVSWLK